MRIVKALTAVCVALILAVQTALPVFAESLKVEDIFAQSAENRGAESFFDNLLYGESDWLALCHIRHYGTEGAEAYLDSVEQEADRLINSEGFVKPTELQRMAVILNVSGRYNGALMNKAVYFNESLDRQGFNAYIWALIAANSANLSQPDGAVNTVQSLAEYILSKQLPDGGFALFGNSADTDVTAMAICALAPMSGQINVSEALKSAEESLSALQQENGGFFSAGVENCESAAQAVMAFAALGYDEKDGRVAKALSAIAEYQRDDGLAHLPEGKSDGLAAAQTAQALTSLQLLKKGECLYQGAEPLEQPSQVKSLEAEGSGEAPTEETTGHEAEQAAKITGSQIKLIICIAAVVLGAALIIAFFVKGRKNRTPLITAIIIIAAGAAVLLLDVRTPEEYYGGQTVTEGVTVTVSAECGSVLSRMDKIDPSINPPEVIPEDGIIMCPIEVTVPEGASAFDALAAAAREDRVQLDFGGTGYGVYINGIGHIYEFGFGAMSGWLYRVNGEFPKTSCGTYQLSEGDKVEFVYSCHITDYNIS